MVIKRVISVPDAEDCWNGGGFQVCDWLDKDRPDNRFWCDQHHLRVKYNGKIITPCAPCLEARRKSEGECG